MQKHIIKTGQVFGRWSVIKEVEPKRFVTSNRTQIKRCFLCRCLCDSATERAVVLYDLLNGKSISCGCIGNEKTTLRNTTHGMSNTTLYYAWKGMIQRCENPKSREYRWYGAIGITVCSRWRKSPQAFFDDMGPSWKPGLTLDRICGEEGYRKQNCRWITIELQQRNRKDNRRVLCNREPMIMTEAAEYIGIGVHVLKYWLNKGCGITSINGNIIKDQSKLKEKI